MYKASLAVAVCPRQPSVRILLQHQPVRVLTELRNQLPVHVLYNLCRGRRQGHPVLLLYRQVLPKLLSVAVFRDLEQQAHISKFMFVLQKQYVPPDMQHVHATCMSATDPPQTLALMVCSDIDMMQLWCVQISRTCPKT